MYVIVRTSFSYVFEQDEVCDNVIDLPCYAIGSLGLENLTVPGVSGQ